MKFGKIPLTAAFATILIASGSLARAASANFTGGNGTDSVDQYEGIAGDGWSTAWARNTAGTNNFQSFVGLVDNTNPLNGGGNYLSTTLVAGAGASKGAQYRGYESFGSLDLSAPYTVKFSLRLDTAGILTAPTDYIQVYDLPGGLSDFAASGTWLIRAFGATTGSSGQIPALTWMFYDGARNGAGYNVNNFTNSGVSLVAGTVYDFVVDMDPTTLSYRVSINEGAFSGWLGYRRGTAPTTSALNFGAQLAGDSKSLSFSLDNIAIVPEPSVASLGLFVGAISGCVMLIRRRYQG